ncbi:MAG: YidC/Oxa1 family membrane protein insertase [Actinomycetota bacterium]
MGFFELFAGALAAFYALIPSFGVAIILLTIAVRLLLLPLSIKQTKSMREMQVIQPEVKKLQQKYKNDRQKLNEETMKLYKEHGVNPFGGCLPLLMQMPLFIGLYQVVRLNVQYMGYEVSSSAASGFGLADDATSGLLSTLAQSKLAQDLLHPDTREIVNQFLPSMRLDCSFLEAWRGVGSATVDATCGSGTPLLASLPYLLLIALMGFTTYYQQRQLMTSRGPQDQQQQQMQMVMRFMPLLLMAFAIGIPIGPGFPAGVVLYWVTTNFWTIVQQRIILARLGPGPQVGAAAKSGAKGKDPKGKDGDAKAEGKKTGSPSPKTSKPSGKKSQGKPSGGRKSTAGTGPGKKKRRR